MFAWNGKPQPQRLTPRRAGWSEPGKARLTVLRDLLPLGRPGFALMLCALLVSVTGCATTAGRPESMPRNPEPPPSALQPSPPSYLDDALRNISEWRRMLLAPTAKPAN